MVEPPPPPDRPIPPTPTSAELFHGTLKLAAKDSRRIHATSELDNGTDEKPGGSPGGPPGGGPGGRSPGSLQRAVAGDAELLLPDHPESRKKQPHTRARPAEHFPPTLTPSDSERKLDRKKSQSGHIAIPVLSVALIKKTKTAILVPNAIVIATTTERLLLPDHPESRKKQPHTRARPAEHFPPTLTPSDSERKLDRKKSQSGHIAIPVLSVALIKKTKTAILVPNAIVIATTTERHVFVSFLSRDNTFKLLKSITLPLDVGNTGSSPVASSCENSFRVEAPSSLPLDLCGDFSDLDSVVRHRRQDMLESSSSGSQTPDYEKMAELSERGEERRGGRARRRSPADRDAKTPDPKRVSVLVLSSCYMAFKIVALEHRLNSLVSVGEYARHESGASHRSQEGFNAEVYKELTSNLLKLEKIQKNLLKLLGET
ncbi:hypothetical protein CRUP_023089 [Coryphaenoides rupestris]|nr:hypothetical protein CRUP_023089 [Coryphaenoides rupestris]